ncbi:2-dehydro-3-deoxy-D-gluconate 5-dehydrogenase [bioreactor metagenome]|uniref:2-dehydro-3-deoxy-D-gluconate 5-dehydrogenase n=1 Tax=bioreactor metagenome TaxID=1076179 RepID=A0A644ZTG4_9ZZZZ|nr:SDR family oxidoreductase [Oscillospiraceae bacterium]
MSVLDMFSLKGKTAVVTGGSGLYGRQIVLSLAQAGAKVYNASRNITKNEEYAASLREKGQDVLSASLDQSSEDSAKQLLDRIEKESGTPSVLVNNAVARAMKSWNSPVSAFTESMRINADGLFIMTRTFGEAMKKDGGSIINIASYMGLLGPDDSMYRGTDVTGDVPDYFFHKGGMVNFTRFTASVLGPYGIRCNVVCPGGYYNGQDPRFTEKYCDRTFLKRMANDTDLMGIMVFLASDASLYITGAVIPADGGYSAK